MEVEILERLVAFNTTQDCENEGILEYIEKLMMPYGFRARRVMKNLILERGEGATLGFLGHTDTVLPTETWSEEPYELTKRNGALYGLGVCDMKGGIAGFLVAAAQTDAPLRLYLTYDEEIGLAGIKDLADESFPARMIIAEPTDGVPIVGTKGSLELTITFRGVRVHSSRPDTGRNAIYDAAGFVAEVRKLGEQLRRDTDDRFDIPYATLNVGIIEGGDAINTTAEKCTLKMDFRTIRSGQREQILQAVQEMLTSYDATYEIGVDVAPFMNDGDVSEIEELTAKKQTASYFTEASYIDKAECVILGPGPMTAHKVDEHISARSLREITRTYAKIIRANQVA
jgi:acetylornithine deacetylase/succinyl-diaminopimelate desuccinylase-like protein